MFVLIWNNLYPLTKRKITVFAFLMLLIAGFLIPYEPVMPVEGATNADYNPQTFWYYPWGKSVTHKGIDVFAKEGTNVLASTNGLVLYCGNVNMGGNIILSIGPKWRFHYYAHLKEIKTSPFAFAAKGAVIGTVGATGNAAGKPPHLHYSIVTPIPYLWRIDDDRQGWKKMFFLNPIDYLEK